MVTGIEAAGLVLGVFPIVIDGLRYCIDSAKKAKGAARHKYVLRRFIRDIEAEMTIFVDTWYHLTGYDPSQGNVPEACAPKLPTHLRPKSISSICIVCENMLDVLEELREKLEKYKKSEVGS